MTTSLKKHLYFASKTTDKGKFTFLYVDEILYILLLVNVVGVLQIVEENRDNSDKVAFSLGHFLLDVVIPEIKTCYWFSGKKVENKIAF